MGENRRRASGTRSRTDPAGKRSESQVAAGASRNENRADTGSDRQTSKIIPISPGSGYDARQERERNTLGRRLQAARLSRNISQRELVDSLRTYGVSVQVPALSKWEGGETLPNPYQFFALCRILEIRDPLAYFTDLFPADQSQVSAFGLNDEGLGKVRIYIKDLLATGLYAARPELSEEDLTECRLYDMAVSAGTGSVLFGEDYELISVPTRTLPQGCDFAVRVQGDSMEPKIHDRQILWVKATGDLRPGEIGIFVYDGEAFVKVYRPVAADRQDPLDESDPGLPRIELESLNPAYAPKPINPNLPFQIVGKVLF